MTTFLPYDEDNGSGIHDRVEFKDHCGNAMEAVVITKGPTDEPYVTVWAPGLRLSFSMQPDACERLGGLLIAAARSARP